MKWIVLALALVGCGVPDSVPLDHSWRPLERVVRDPTRRPGWFATRAPCVYAANPAALFDGSVESAAVLTHERLHAQRQLDYGVDAWIVAYNNDPKFRTREELDGWALQIAYMVHHGVTPDPYGVAEMLMSYTVPLALTREQALAWAAHVIQEEMFK